MKLLLIALLAGKPLAHANDGADFSDETSLMQLSTSSMKHGQMSMKHGQRSQFKMRPKTEWEEPLTAEEEAVFETDMRMPINQWLQQNPSLDSDYFVQWGVNRSYGELMFWDGVHNVSDYVEFGQTGAALWFDLPDYLGEGKGPRTTWSVEGSVITSRHLDAGSYLPDDAYCWTFGWLKGQGIDGTLMSDKSAWDAVAEQECQKIGDALSTYLPEDNHTVYRHVMWNRVWPSALDCNIVDGPDPPSTIFREDVDCNAVDCSMMYVDASDCKPVTKNQLREHVYRKCLFGFAATEVAYCYSRGCLLNGNEIGHGSECS
mmetsp:Transcript_28280/g.51847  ORF Transcript_28280/g.51847 Transcript_28280/m.51847 type:complete len:317 (+) Transcript_28280:94-1044(+)